MTDHEKIRLLFVIENERYGGGERAFAQLINGLDKGRFEVYTACLSEPSNGGSSVFVRAVEGAAKVINLDLRRLVNPGAVSAIKKIVREKGINIIHSQGPRADFYCRLAAGGTRLVSTVASPVEEYDAGPLRRGIYSLFDGFLRGKTDAFVAVAEHIEKKLLLKGIASEKIVRIYNGVDTAACSPVSGSAARTRDAYGIAPDVFLAGTFSRLSSEKGLFTLIEAAKLATVDIPQGAIRYVIAGEGPLDAGLKSKVAELGLEKSFIFTGFLPDVKPLMGAVDVFLLPSAREGFPLGLLEAMAMSRPSVASDIDGVNEIVSSGSNGLLFPHGEAPALASAITALFRDRPLAAALGAQAAKDIAERFGIDKMVAGHEELYSGLGAI